MKINFLFHDYSGDREGWSKLFVFSYAGDLPQCEGSTDEEEIIRLAGREAFENGYWIASEGGDAGRPFANPPILTIYKNHLTITQSGGLDV